MKNKYSFYLQKDNELFGGRVLVICYNANQSEIEKYGLTSENVLFFIKTKKLNDIEEKTVDFFDVLKNLFEKDVYLRIQSECLLGSYGDSHCDCEQQKKQFIELLKDNDGIYIHLPQEAQGWGLFYKCKELELQINGRAPNGLYVNPMTRDEAQKYLEKSNKFNDKRDYKLVFKLLNELSLKDKSFILYTENEDKINEMKNNGFSVIRYSKYIEQNITNENASEYLIKILNGTHKYKKNVIDKIYDIFISRKYNDRTLETLIDIVNAINNNNINIDAYTKKQLIEAYNEIICGEEKNYILRYSSISKIQNKFSCQVNAMIFKQLLNIYHHNIFDRICFEKMYCFLNKKSKDIKKIRTSKVLDIRNEETSFFKGQVYSIERTTYNDSKTIEENSTSMSKLRTLFENSDYEFTKRQEMICYISENDLEGVNVYIKRLPKTENWILDVYGKSENIRNFIDTLAKQRDYSLLNFVNNIKLEEGEYSDYNLRFSDLELAITEELEIFNNLNEGENKDGNRS